jgi:hypothetical protein
VQPSSKGKQTVPQTETELRAILADKLEGNFDATLQRAIATLIFWGDPKDEEAIKSDLRELASMFIWTADNWETMSDE